MYGVLAIESPSNAPVPANRYRPCSFSIARQFVQSKSWQIHVLWYGRGVKPSQDQADSRLVFRLDARLAAFGEVALKTTVPKALDHLCIVT
jgi:hypothetical protein